MTDFRLHGEKLIRGDRQVPLSPVHEGRFGRMFRRLPPCPPLPEDVLVALAAGMVEAEPAPAGGWNSLPQPQVGGDNMSIPAGYTYLGQFIDHDITFDPNSSLQQLNDPDALTDFRSPRFDLDSLYGSGPADEPFQYVPDSDPAQLLVEANANGIEDLPRNSQGTALIGDPRNDENTIVSQLQLFFLKLHNVLAAQVAADPTVPAEQRFAATQRLVRWHYQWVIVKDYLPRTVGAELVNQLFDDTSGEIEIRRRYYRPRNNAYMPIEFSAAAFRFGHSQVRGVYDLNSVVTGRPIFLPGDVGPTDDLRGRRPLPQSWSADWSMFFTLPGAAAPQPSRLIDTKIAPGLFNLPGSAQSLAERNLRRGEAMSLPSGQDVARHLHVPNPLTGADLGGAPEPTPLWFYILKEAELGGGEHLGPVGGRIVAEVLLGLLEMDKQSWINVDQTWTPTLPDIDGDGRFTMGDLLKAVF